MTLAKIQCFGGCVELIPCSTLPNNPEKYVNAQGDGAICVFLLPSLTDDVRCTVIDDGGAILFPSLPHPASVIRAAAASALFLRRVRGLPLDMVDVETDIGRISVSFEKNTLRPAVKMPKCKLLVANAREICQNVEIFCDIYDTEIGLIKLIKCERVENFSEEALRQLSHGAEDGRLAVSCAFSERDGAVSAKAVSPAARVGDTLPFLSSAISAKVRRYSRADRISISVADFRTVADLSSFEPYLISVDPPPAVYDIDYNG